MTSGAQDPTIAKDTNAALRTKRAAKPGFRKVTIQIPEEDYDWLQTAAIAQSREVNNMLAFALKGRLQGILADYQD